MTIRAKVDEYLGSAVPRPEVTIRAGHAPIVASDRNTAVACDAALEVVKASNEQEHDVRNMFVGWRGYNVVNGIKLQYTGRYTFRDTEVYAQDDQVSARTAGLMHGLTLIDTAHVNFKIVGWSKPVVLSQRFGTEWSTPAMLYVNGSVKLRGAAAEVPFDVVSTATSPNQHVWVEGADDTFSVPWYVPSIHKIATYTPDMNPSSAYVPPAPTITSPLTLAVKGIPANAWGSAVLRVIGTRTDSAGAAPGDPAFNVPGYFSVWRPGTLRALYQRGTVMEGNKEYLTLTDHVVDRTTGHLRSFPIKVEIVPYVP